MVAEFHTKAEAEKYCDGSRDLRWTYHVPDKKVPYGC
jgi:hypothetical protein